MTKREEIILEFAMAMRSAHVPYIAEQGVFTPNLDRLWNLFVEACQQEVKDGRSK